MESPFFGWEILSALTEDIQCPSDLAVVFVHWQLIKLGFSCLGTGDQKFLSNEDCESELLPDGWNCDCDATHYSLRYVLGKDLYILTCIVLGESTALFNLFNVCKGTVANVSLELREIMATNCLDGWNKRKLTELIPKAEVLIARINRELIAPVAGCVACSKDTPNRQPDPVLTDKSPMERCISRNQTEWDQSQQSKW